MSDPITPPADGIARALGRIPSGLFIVTIRRGEASTGLLASWVQQAGFDPPVVSVAVKADRYHASWIRESGRFGVNQIASGDKILLRHFGKGFAPEESAFEGIPLLEAPSASTPPLLAGALTALEAEVVGEHQASDHILFLGKIVGGRVNGELAEPYVHLRQNGMKY